MRHLIYSTIILLFATLSGVNAQVLGGNNVKVNFRKIELRDAKLHVDMDINVAAGTVKSKQSVSITPILRNASGKTKQLPSVMVSGRNRAKIYRRLEKFDSRYWAANRPMTMVIADNDRGNTIPYIVEIPYEDWMDGSDLLVDGKVVACALRENHYALDAIRKSLNFAPPAPAEPYQIQPMLAYITPEQEKVKVRAVNYEAYIDFPSGSSIIQPNYRNNPNELSKIGESLKKVTGEDGVTITAIDVTGYASPEGSSYNNTRLSEKRAMALRRYIFEQYDIQPGIIRIQQGGEDWYKLRKMVADSRMSYKEQVLAIIDGGANEDTKEARLKLIGGGTPYHIIFDEMYPQLRRVDYRISFTVKDYATSEARDVVGKDPSLLSEYELYTLAQSYPEGSADYQKIYDIIIAQYPNDAAANTDGAAAMILRGDYATAERLLNKAGNSAEATNNMGVLYMMQGKLDVAEALLTKAQSLGCAAAVHNLTELQKKRADGTK